MPQKDEDALSEEQRLLFLERLAEGYYRTGDVRRYIARCLCADMVPPPPAPSSDSKKKRGSFGKSNDVEK